MSIRLSDWDIDEEEWLPNPYQAQVEAQLRQSHGLPGSSSEMPHFTWHQPWQCNFFPGTNGLPSQGQWYPTMYCVVAHSMGEHLARQQVAPLVAALTAHKIDAERQAQEQGQRALCDSSTDVSQVYGGAPVTTPSTPASEPAHAIFPVQNKLAQQTFIATYNGLRPGKTHANASSTIPFAVFHVLTGLQYERVHIHGDYQFVAGNEFLICLDESYAEIYDIVMQLAIGATVQITYIHVYMDTGFKCQQERFVQSLIQVVPEAWQELQQAGGAVDPQQGPSPTPSSGELRSLEGNVGDPRGEDTESNAGGSEDNFAALERKRSNDFSQDQLQVKLEAELLSEAGQLSHHSDEDAAEASDTGSMQQESPHQPWGFLHEFRIARKASTASSGQIETDVSQTGPETTATEGEYNRSNGANLQEPEAEAQDSDQAGGNASRFARKLSHLCVPKNTDLGKQFSDDKAEDQHITTLMIRNIPNLYTRSMLVDELDSLGFQGLYDFLYLPIDKSTQWNVGYAFVNFVEPAVAARCREVMTNYTCCRFEHGSDKVVQISVAHIQGLERNLAYYSNTAVQCSRMESHRPLVLSNGPPEVPLPPRRSPRRRRRNRKARGAARAPDTTLQVCDGEVSSGGEQAAAPLRTSELHVRCERRPSVNSTDGESLSTSPMPSSPQSLSPAPSVDNPDKPKSRRSRRGHTVCPNIQLDPQGLPPSFEDFRLPG